MTMGSVAFSGRLVEARDRDLVPWPAGSSTFALLDFDRPFISLHACETEARQLVPARVPPRPRSVQLYYNELK